MGEPFPIVSLFLTACGGLPVMLKVTPNTGVMTSPGGAEYHDYQHYVGGQSHTILLQFSPAVITFMELTWDTGIRRRSLRR
ncbi:unnamed protein product [Prunus brigantina]